MKLKCNKCHYEWIRRIIGAEPKECPRCKSRCWNEESRLDKPKTSENAQYDGTGD